MQNAARGVLTGKIYDQIAIAQRNQDQEALQKANTELSRINPLVAAEQLVNTALQLDIRGDQLSNPAEKRKLEVQATQKYREALRISPLFPSKSPELLNALGYFLADRGTTQQDFKTAESLTRAALKQWDQALEQLKDTPLLGGAYGLAQFQRAIGPQDSLAWALFKQKRFDEASKEQQEALKTAEKLAPSFKTKVSADLYFHFAEIERARGHIDIARANYQTAMQLDPKHTPSLNALRSLSPQAPPVTPPAKQPPAIPPPLEPPPMEQNSPGIDLTLRA